MDQNSAQKIAIDSKPACWALYRPKWVKAVVCGREKATSCVAWLHILRSRSLVQRRSGLRLGVFSQVLVTGPVRFGRTERELARSPDFKSGAINRSARAPHQMEWRVEVLGLEPRGVA